MMVGASPGESVSDSCQEFRVQGSGFRVQGSGFTVHTENRPEFRSIAFLQYKTRTCDGTKQECATASDI